MPESKDISKSSSFGPEPVNNAQSIESLPSNARQALWRLQHLLQAGSRVPVFALVGPFSADLTKVILALCRAEGGYYIRLSEYIGQQVLDDPNFREEWITAYHLAQVVMNLTDSCPGPFLAIDDWEIVLALIRDADANAHLTTLTLLAHLSLHKPVILVLPTSHGSFSGADEVQGQLEAGGRPHVIVLTNITSNIRCLDE